MSGQANHETCERDEECARSHIAAHRTGNDDLRTHMANERTFLAWCRTSIAMVVFGFVVEKFDLLLKAPGYENAGAHKFAPSSDLYLVSLFSFILSGVIILVSGYRFLYVRKNIKAGRVSVSIFPEVMVIISMVVIIAVVILLLMK